MLNDREAPPQTGLSRRRLFAAATAAGFSGTVLSACGSGSESAASEAKAAALTDVPGFRGADPEGRYYWVAHAGAGDPYWATVKRGAEAIGKRMGLKVTFEGPDQYDPTKQANMISAAVSSKAAGIVTTAADPNAVRGPVEQAAKAGIPVVFADTPPPDDYDAQFTAGGPFAFVGTDIAQVARQVAAKVVPLLPHGAPVVIINHEPGNTILETKSNGYIEGLKPIAPQVDRLNVGTEVTRGAEILRAYQSKHKDLKAVFSLGAIGTNIAVSFRKEVNATPEQIRIAGSDIDEFTTDAIEHDQVVATIGIPAFQFGLVPIPLLFFYNAYALYPADYIQSGGDVVTKDNIAMFQALSKKGFR